MELREDPLVLRGCFSGPFRHSQAGSREAGGSILVPLDFHKAPEPDGSGIGAEGETKQLSVYMCIYIYTHAYVFTHLYMYIDR